MSKPIIHIGFPKTATTWLQKEFFPNVANINFVQREDIIEKILRPNTFEIDFASTKNYFKNKKRTVICDEILVGGLDACFGNGAFIKETGMRLKQIFDEAEIIIFIRNQPSIIASTYFQYIRAGGNYSAKKYLRQGQKHYPFLVNQLLFSYDIFKFDQTLSFYKQLYGNENVHVYLYEDFKEDREAFLIRLKQKFELEIDIHNLKLETIRNARYKKIFVKLARFTNSFCIEKNLFKYYIFNIPKMFVLSHKIFTKLNNYRIFGKYNTDAEIIGTSSIKKIQEVYKQSNKNLIEKHGLECIKKYNYPL